MAVTTLTPSSELEAINAMLAAIGEQPVNSLNDSGLSLVAMARQLIRNASRALQQRGWHWNTEVNYTLALSLPQKFIYLPANTLRADTSSSDIDLDVVQRGDRLYDRIAHSYAFDRSITAELVIFLDFNELPEAARYYITSKAARALAQAFGSQELVSFTMQDEMEAMRSLQEAEGDTADHNILTGSYDVFRSLER